MGPGSFDPGSICASIARLPCTRLQWGRGLSTPEVYRPRPDGTNINGCFNGAGVFRPRKCPVSLRRCSKFKLLQWGRGLSTPEVFLLERPRPPKSALQWGRGLSTPEVSRSMSCVVRRPRFNGAGVFRPRKCGDAGPTNLPGFQLQWGRGLSTPEVERRATTCAMRPCASMGPGSFDPGSVRGRVGTRRKSKGLQWGRGLSTPEVACAVTILFSKSLRRGCERRLARRASSLRTSIAPECNPLQALYIGRRERLCYFPRRSAARAPHRVTNTGYSFNSPSSVFASSRV